MQDTIYTPSICYTYLIGWSNTKMFYYGCQYRKGASPTHLWTKYFTSSSYVKDYRETYGEPDIIQIRKTFENRAATVGWEMRVLRRIGAKKRADFLNKTDVCAVRSPGIPLTQEHKANIARGIKGKVIISELQKQAIKKSNSTRLISNETRAKMSAFKKPQHVRDAVANSNKTRVISEETRAKLKASAIRRNSDPVFIAQRKLGMKKKNALHDPFLPTI